MPLSTEVWKCDFCCSPQRHWPSWFVGRRAISALYLLARTSQDASSHIDRVDSSVDVRYLFCISWPENHKMHHRTSTESIRQSACDVCFVSIGQKTYAPQTKILDGWTKHCVMRFWTSFQSVVAQNVYSHPWKVLQKRIRNALFNRPKSSFGEHKTTRFISHIDRVESSLSIVTWCQPSATSPLFFDNLHFYGLQTKILECRTNIRERIFKGLFKWT